MTRARTLAAGLWAALLAASGARAAREPSEAPVRGQGTPRHQASTPVAPPNRELRVAPAPSAPALPAAPGLRTPAAARLVAPAPGTGLQRPVDTAVVRGPSASAAHSADPLIPARAPIDSTGNGSEPLQGAPFRVTDPLTPPAAPQHPLAPQAGSPEAAAHVRVTIRSIAARRAGEVLEIDGRLRQIDRDLRSFAEQFNYKLYQLLDEQTVELDFLHPTQLELPGQRSLEVQPTEQFKDGRLRLHLELLGPHPSHERRLHTDYSLPRGRTILVGGYRVDPDRPESGTLLLAITQVE